MFAILENGSVETMLRYRLMFSTGRAFAIPRSVKNKDGRDDPTKLRSDVHRGLNAVNHRKLARALAARRTSHERSSRPRAEATAVE